MSLINRTLQSFFFTLLNLISPCFWPFAPSFSPDDLLRPLRQMVKFQLGRGTLDSAAGSRASPTSPDPHGSGGRGGDGPLVFGDAGSAEPPSLDAPVRELTAAASHVKAAAPHRRQRHGVVPWRQRPFASLALPKQTATATDMPTVPVPPASPAAALATRAAADGPGSESS